MAARLSTFVHVLDEHGASHRFGPGDDIPGWAVEQITNPHVWAVLPEPVVVSEVPESPEVPPAVEEAVPVPAPAEEPEPAPAEPKPTPKPTNRRTK